MLTLREISEKLLQADEDLAEALTKFIPIEMKFTGEYHRRLLQSGMATQALKDAEVKEGMRTDGFTDEYEEARLRVKLAYARKDVLMEVSRNIRSLAFGNE